MKEKTIFKCGYSHCKHGGEVNKEDGVLSGTRWFHPDCLAEKNAILEIIDVWYKRVDEHPIFTNLRRTIDNLVYKEGNDAEFLLFSLNYCLDHGWNLKHPPGLRYVAKNEDAKKAWEKQKAVSTPMEFPKFENTGTQFTYNPVNKPKIDDLFSS